MFQKLNSRFFLSDTYFVDIECPVCGANSPFDLLKRDRYLLPIFVAFCEKCSHVYTRRNIGDKKIKDFYENHYRKMYENVTHVDDDYIYESRDKLKASYRFLSITRAIGSFDSVIEIGSGLGFYLKTCADAGIPHVYGYEIGKTFCEFSAETSALKGRVAQSMVSTETIFPFQPSLVVMFHVLEHIIKPLPLLKMLYQSMPDDSHLCIEVPDILGDWSKLGIMNFHIAHASYFSAQSLSRLLMSAGFSPISISRENDDGIYHGNLRIISRRIAKADQHEPPALSGDELSIILEKFHKSIRPYSVKNGYPRAIARLLK